ncbi:uncharacterized protein SAPINGB_P005335 [Magnusiomyces paraingens]|uniref:DNA 3'-5' helicase n=1 Tax=Magnusiomyces paraingens TaxID=2606893 RepID=A0A5E8C4T5_9ASCO|nr:uncharacterized protein SAPINGB_P005335 [Saprochaete ingens]VVT56848.1 unnamed protein product [Saprochaete ingens]
MPLWADPIDNSPFQSTFSFNNYAKEIILPESKTDDDELKHKRLARTTSCVASLTKPNMLLEPLDEMQNLAATGPPNLPLQIIGGPGTGKSKILGYRAAWLIYKHNVPPENISIFSRTRLAAQELVTNVTSKLEEIQYKGNIDLTAGTIHYYCLRYLNLFGDKLNLVPNFTILSQEQQRDFVSSVLVSSNVVNIGERQGYYPQNVDQEKNASRAYRAKARYSNESLSLPLIDVSFVCEAINYIKSKGISIDEWVKTPPAASLPLMREIFKEYEARLRKQDLVDLNDLVLLGLRLIAEYPETVKNIQHVLVDSFEDLTAAQYRFICALSQSGGLSVAGDPNQGIYLSHNPQPYNFAHMQRQFPQTQLVSLHVNYRSTESLVKLGQQVIEYDQTKSGLITPSSKAIHIEKNAHPLGPATVTFFTFEAEVRAVSAFIKYLTQRYDINFSDFALLDRYSQTPEVLALMREALESEGIPYTILGREFWQQREIVSLLSVFRTIQSNKNEEDAVDSAAWMNMPIPPSDVSRIMKFGIAPTYFEKLETYSRGEVHSSFFSMTPNGKEKVIKFVGFVTLWRSITKFSQRLEPADSRLLVVMEKLFDSIVQKFNDNSWKYRTNSVFRHKENVALLRERFLQTMGSLDPAIVARFESGLPDYLATFLRLQAIDYVVEMEDDHCLTIGTAYGAKGREWPVVFAMKFGESVLKDVANDYDEALRKFYVSLSSASGSCFLMADFISHRQDFIVQGERVDPVYPLLIPSQSGDGPLSLAMDRVDRFPEQHFAMFPAAERILETEVFSKRDVSIIGLRETRRNRELAVEYQKRIAAVRAMDEVGGQIMAQRMSNL